MWEIWRVYCCNLFLNQELKYVCLIRRLTICSAHYDYLAICLGLSRWAIVEGSQEKAFSDLGSIPSPKAPQGFSSWDWVGLRLAERLNEERVTEIIIFAVNILLDGQTSRLSWSGDVFDIGLVVFLFCGMFHDQLVNSNCSVRVINKFVNLKLIFTKNTL